MAARGGGKVVGPAAGEDVLVRQAVLQVQGSNMVLHITSVCPCATRSQWAFLTYISQASLTAICSTEEDRQAWDTHSLPDCGPLVSTQTPCANSWHRQAVLPRCGCSASPYGAAPARSALSGDKQTSQSALPEGARICAAPEKHLANFSSSPYNTGRYVYTPCSPSKAPVQFLLFVTRQLSHPFFFYLFLACVCLSIWHSLFYLCDRTGLLSI